MEKRVLLVATVPSMIGQFNMNNIRILKNMGYKVDVATDFNDTSVWTTERIMQFKKDMEAIEVECFQIDFSRSPLHVKRHIESYNEIKKLILQRKYAFIHTHTPIASAIVRVAAHKTKTKVIYTAHGFHFYDGAPIKNWVLFYPVEKFLSKWTDVLITINKEDYKRAVNNFNVKKTFYVPGVGVDIEKFSTYKVDKEKKRLEIGVKTDDLILLSVGELSVRKNQKVIIESLGKMKQEGTIGSIVYLIVGKGELQEFFQALIEKHGLQDHVKMLGFRSDIAELLHVADLFVFPSLQEGLPVALMEAMASGTPCLASTIRGNTDLLDNIPKALVSFNTVNEWKKSIIEATKLDFTYMSACMLSEINKFRVDNINSIMRDIYNQVMLD